MTYLGRERNPGAIILISPFTSIKDVAKNMVGEIMSHVIYLILLYFVLANCR